MRPRHAGSRQWQSFSRRAQRCACVADVATRAPRGGESRPRTPTRTELASTPDRVVDGGLLVDMTHNRWQQKFFGDDLDLYLANEAGISVRVIAKQQGISKSVVAALIARVCKRLTADSWTEEPTRPTEPASHRGSPRGSRDGRRAR